MPFFSSRFIHFVFLFLAAATAAASVWQEYISLYYGRRAHGEYMNIRYV